MTQNTQAVFILIFITANNSIVWSTKQDTGKVQSKFIWIADLKQLQLTKVLHRVKNTIYTNILDSI